MTSKQKQKRIDSSFSFIASHELKAPLSAMKWLLNMLIRGDTGVLTPDQLDVLEEVSKNNEQMIDLIDNITDVESLTQPNNQLEKKKFNLTQTLTHLLDQMHVFAKARNVVLKLSMQRDALTVEGDEKRIRDTMHNFISNAIKYTPGKGEVHISLDRMPREELQGLVEREQVKIDMHEVEKLPQGLYAVFRVKDSGIGISPEQQQQIFQKFYRSDEAIKMNTRGTGLGLYIDKLIIAQSGGAIWFHSIEKQGSTFAFALPLL